MEYPFKLKGKSKPRIKNTEEFIHREIQVEYSTIYRHWRSLFPIYLSSADLCRYLERLSKEEGRILGLGLY